MRILHAPTNIAGQPYVLSRALRRLGHQSDVLVEKHHPFGYPEDRVLDFEKLASPWRQIRKGIALLGLIRNYDVFHFYFGGSLLSAHRDLPLIRRAGKRILFHFRGCEIRMRASELAQREVCACRECPAPCDTDQQKSALRDVARKWAHRILVATPDLLEWVPEAHLVVQAIDLAVWPSVSPPGSQKQSYVILHAPSDPLIKGTAHVVRAVDQLRQEGYPVELKLLTGKPHDEMRQAILDADVVIDQLMVGWYGNFAVEAMASSRPVIAHVREDLVNRTKAPPPILNATPADLQQVLRRLLDDPALRRDLARAGRSYVAQVHDANHIAEQLVACYQGIHS